ncbi:MAG TPA: SUMF1/EgtB/PvdO family nonheme iron enzyme [Polyangia bacterium]|nr:SUMF1/EgtB/PvdO family nonheme iron enzyme [Polyangia bacterium]
METKHRFQVPILLAALAIAGCWQGAAAEVADAGDGGIHNPILDNEWVSLPAGIFLMGAFGMAWSEPVHLVAVPAFDLTRTEITVADFRECVDDGACEPPAFLDENCNWDQANREDHPINCVEWQQAVAFCAWSGGRLPSESEWEYAARSAGTTERYPWGELDATCQRAIMDGGGGMTASGYGCGELRTWPVCSKPQGDSAQGLCDLSGNAAEWVQDWFHPNYDGHPPDGSAWEYPAGVSRVLRGGGYTLGAYPLLAAKRDYLPAGPLTGFRCAR